MGHDGSQYDETGCDGIDLKPHSTGCEIRLALTEGRTWLVGRHIVFSCDGTSLCFDGR